MFFLIFSLVCKDHFPLCRRFKAMCTNKENQHNRALIELHCPLTCGKCSADHRRGPRGRKIKMSDWNLLWLKQRGKLKKLCSGLKLINVRHSYFNESLLSVSVTSYHIIMAPSDLWFRFWLKRFCSSIPFPQFETYDTYTDAKEKQKLRYKLGKREANNHQWNQCIIIIKETLLKTFFRRCNLFPSSFVFTLFSDSLGQLKWTEKADQATRLQN